VGKFLWNKKNGILLCLIGMFFIAGCGGIGTGSPPQTTTGYNFKDSQGTLIYMEAKPQRIVTLSMSTDEIMLGLVETGKMAAINKLLDDPVSSNIAVLAAKIPAKIGNPSIEEIVALSPDLIVVPDWGNIENAAALRELGFKVAVCKGPKNIDEIKETIVLLAAAAGEPQRGKLLVEKMDRKLEEIRKKVEQIMPAERKNIVLLSLMRSYGGRGCTFDDACRLAGVTNAVSAAGIQNGQAMTKEQLVSMNPDILFLPTYRDHGKYDINSFRREYLDDPSLQSMKAIQQKQLAEPREGYIYNCSQDIVFGVQEIAYMAYGDRFSQPGDCHLSALAAD